MYKEMFYKINGHSTFRQQICITTGSSLSNIFNTTCQRQHYERDIHVDYYHLISPKGYYCML